MVEAPRMASVATPRRRQLLGQGVQRRASHAAGHDERALAALGRLPSATDGADHLHSVADRELCHVLSAEAEHLVHHVHRARLRIGRVHAEGAAQDVGLHARHLHVHELPRPRRRRDFRRAHGHEPDVAPHLLVHQNGRVLVAKRHRLSCRVSGKMHLMIF